ncbi:5-oxoprolinase subunit PxpA [Nocardioides cynanchi]|uniref:5-oxoprolinase subunit PxpA n=1 Tax=Nocardioides cynanchi TaxID=2558918 RepID=UPI001247D7E2|nr:5-oxoprolinase subunit PxpA [Nocardioides cynanchi]
MPADPPGAVDLNADLGEEVTDDSGLLAVVTSANVACGFHAGTPAIMRAVCAEAARLGVVVGAQVSYRDRANFGRVARDVGFDDLREQVAEQVGLLSRIAVDEGTAVAYLKPHGALYHRVTDDLEQAAAVLAGSGTLPVLGFPGAVLLDLARDAGRASYDEGFPDRRYLDGRLVDRAVPGALLLDVDEIARQAVALAPRVASLCVHGDSPGAVAHAEAVRRALSDAGHRLRSFLPGR